VREKETKLSGLDEVTGC